MRVRENQELIMENVLSFRGKMTQQQMQEEMVEIGQVLQDLGVQKNGPVMTATYAVEQMDNKQVMDIELLIPMNRDIKLPKEYTFKPIIKIMNALCIRHEGHPARLQDTINRLNAYILEHNKQVITAAYNVTVKNAESQEELNDMIIDIYVGCSPCIV
ncbi:MAG: AraC family transcriptional regulator [Epulopiscium sp.]|nr:AraC family transcriptional regulator [Candidatus Epulonipiscium sp.]